MVDDTTTGRTTELAEKGAPELNAQSAKRDHDSSASFLPSCVRAGKRLVAPLCPLVVHGSIHPVDLVATVHALEKGNAILAHPLEEARPHWVPSSREQKCTLGYALPVGAGLHLVRLEPGRAVDIVLDDGAGCSLGGS
jgi:hypothetical protein